MPKQLWKFTDNLGSFEFPAADKIKSLYFPIANEKIMSSLSPDLHGDIKASHDSFLLIPVSRIDLVNLRASRNFWIYPVRNIKAWQKENKISNGVYIDKYKVWSATGVSKDIKQIEKDHFNLKAGLLWQRIERENKKIGLRAEVLSFVPASGEAVEIMQVKLTNISSQKIKFTPCAAIPLYARSANNLRNHRHVTTLLQRIILHKFGVISRPTLVFDESGHKPNRRVYFVLGWEENFIPPQYLYPTQEMFCGEAGDLEAPVSILKNILPDKHRIQGKEAMGALRFPNTILNPQESRAYIILMGITEDYAQVKSLINKFNSLDKVKDALEQTKAFWVTHSQQIGLSTGDSDFDNWFRWVSIQPSLRKIFGCSFLPDFDYGKGGRGWRDLWQDCLGLILNNAHQVRQLLINNFSGVRIDGSNATIIAKKEGEFTPPFLKTAKGIEGRAGFISDRNNLSRVWMDHGIWPLLTLDLYLNETADFDILFEETNYFRNHEINRTRSIDYNWNPSYGNKLKTSTGKIYKGTLLEHLLVENLVQFFNVGNHNHIRLEGGDWNDGLDMACERGESIAFSAMYAHNLKVLSDLLLKIGGSKIVIASELKILLSKIDYNNVNRKLKILDEYFTKTKSKVSGIKVNIDVNALANNLREKSEWIANHIRKSGWLKQGFFNGYYDNLGKPVEGRKNNLIKMMLSSQVFPIMSGVAKNWQVSEILKSVDKYLFDKKLKGFHLNTDFKDEERNLGRAFSFVYGDKENGAFFNHMIVLFSYALYKRGFVYQGWQVLNSVYKMAVNTPGSKIYPCLPEYFNLEGRGMYAYLTGSASWFVLTIVTEVFGVKGKDGDLLIEPKLVSEQFKHTSNLSINRMFAARNLKISFFNPKKREYGRYRIIKVSLNSQGLALKESPRMLISRETILKLPADKVNTLNITLG